MLTVASLWASGCDMGQGCRLLVDANGHGFERHIAVLELPLVVLFEQDGSDEPRDGRLVGEDADEVGATLHLRVQPFDQLG